MARLDIDVNKMTGLDLFKSSSLDQLEDSRRYPVKKTYSTNNVPALNVFNSDSNYKSWRDPMGSGTNAKASGFTRSNNQRTGGTMNKTMYQPFIPGYTKSNLNTTFRETRDNDRFDFKREFSNNFMDNLELKEYLPQREYAQVKNDPALENANYGEPKTKPEEKEENEHVCLVGKDLEEFRTKQCPLYAKGLCLNSSRCSLSHSETWPRRNPVLFKYDYKLCPNIQFSRHENKMQLHGKCSFGRRCRFSHSKEEQLYHPDLYKTRYCLNYPNCKGYYCPFAHSKEELRTFNTLNNSFNNFNKDRDITREREPVKDREFVRDFSRVNKELNNVNRVVERDVVRVASKSPKEAKASRDLFNRDYAQNQVYNLGHDADYSPKLDADLKTLCRDAQRAEGEDVLSNTTTSCNSSYNADEIEQDLESTMEGPTAFDKNLVAINEKINNLYLETTLYGEGKFGNRDEGQNDASEEEENWFEMLIRNGLNLLDDDKGPSEYLREDWFGGDELSAFFESLGGCSRGDSPCPMCSSQKTDGFMESRHTIKQCEDIFKYWG